MPFPADPRSIDTGVPQGSDLLATLFTLYINDLLKTLPLASSIAYADDVTIIFHGDNQAIAAANSVNVIASVTKWAQENDLLLTHQKVRQSLSHLMQERSLQFHTF